MSSLSKHKKCSKGLYVGQCEDRITNLPSNLLTKILSYLPTKHAVATSVLSTRWKRSWTSITNLDFDDAKPRFCTHSDTPIFTRFVNRVMLIRDNSCLQRFSLKCADVSDDSLVNAWLTDVIHCNIQEIDITIAREYYPSLLLPSDMFLCSTLVALRLAVKGYVNMSASVCLPSLRILHIDGVQLSNDVSIISLLSGCHVLEELYLSRCLGNDVHGVDIIAPALKSLIMKDLACDSYVPSTGVKYHIMIDTPALENFIFVGHIARVYVVSNMYHLIKAEINFDHTRWNDYSQYTNLFREKYSEAFSDLLKRISQVQTLVLSCHFMLVIKKCHLSLPKFSNLTYLKLNSEGALLLEFLNNSPCLETLYIDQESTLLFEKDNLDMLPLLVPSCFLFHLKEIEIDAFEGIEDEMEFIEYILKNAKVLEKLTVHYLPSEEVVTDVEVLKFETMCYKELLAVPRASTLCKVMICSL